MDSLDAVAALGALAQETRLEIFRLLVQAGDDGMAAGQIAARLELPPATLSFHLNQLRHAGLISYRRESRSLIYAAEYAAMNSLVGYLTENCCQGSGTCDVTAPTGRFKRTITGKGVRNHEANARARRR
jgi:DNA-binding transcriptional ArsR family regulator